jgi:hypothetical protein
MHNYILKYIKEILERRYIEKLKIFLENYSKHPREKLSKIRNNIYE